MPKTRSVVFDDDLDEIISQRMKIERRPRSSQIIHMLYKLLKIENEKDIELALYGGVKKEAPNDTNTP